MKATKAPDENQAEQAIQALRRVTASKLDLAMECLHWTTLDLPADRTGDSARIMGNPFHEDAATGAHGAKLDDHENYLTTERFRGWLERGRRLLPATYREEVAYCLGPDGTVTRIGEGLDRDYGAHVGLCGTIDVDSRDKVIDYKTGKRLKPVKDAWQMRFASVVTGARERAFHYIDAAGNADEDTYVSTAAERADDKARLVLLQSDILTGRTAAKPGEHCAALYCPARKVCEPRQAHLKQQETPMGKMTLSNVTRGKLESPFAVLLYGTEGIGKSSFAADAPNPIFLDPDNGTGELDVARFPVPGNWADVLEALDTLANEKHEHKTFVTDTLDTLESIMHREVCRVGGKKGIEDFGYGKGFTAALDLGKLYLQKLDALRARGMHIITLGQATVKTFQNPAGDDYDRYRMAIHEKLYALFKAWHTAVLFANYQTYMVEKGGKVQALGDGSRMLYTEHRPAWDAKNRYGLPAELPLNWAEFERAARAGEPESIEKLKAAIAELLEKANDELKNKGTAGLQRAGEDVRKLSALADWLRGKIAAQAQTTETAVTNTEVAA
jgi:hypothetical protein